MLELNAEKVLSALVRDPGGQIPITLFLLILQQTIGCLLLRGSHIRIFHICLLELFKVILKEMRPVGEPYVFGRNVLRAFVRENLFGVGHPCDTLCDLLKLHFDNLILQILPFVLYSGREHFLGGGIFVLHHLLLQ